MNSLILSNPLDPIQIEILSIVSAVATKLNINFFVIGATARDIVLYNLYNIKPANATMDIDFALMVESWPLFFKMRQELLGFKEFSEEHKVKHRVFYKNYPIDLVPFGFNLSTLNQNFSWPPDYNVIMNIQGFNEVYKNSISVEIQQNVNIQIASLAGQVILKFMAWHDRKNIKNQDAKDIGLILLHYLDAGNYDRLFTEELDWLDEEDEFDYEMAGAKLLCRDILHIVEKETLARLIQIIELELNDENGSNKFIENMMYQASNSYQFDTEERINKGFLLLKYLQKELSA